MRLILFIILTIFIAGCSSKRTSTTKTHNSMGVEDVSKALESCFTDFAQRSLTSGSDDRYLFKVSPEEYEAFVDRFQIKLEKLGKDSYSYQASGFSATQYDDNLSFFSISLGEKNTFDIIISGVYDVTNQRLLINVYTFNP